MVPNPFHYRFLCNLCGLVYATAIYPSTCLFPNSDRDKNYIIYIVKHSNVLVQASQSHQASQSAHCGGDCSEQS